MPPKHRPGRWICKTAKPWTTWDLDHSEHERQLLVSTHFKDEETESQRGSRTFPRSRELGVVEPGFTTSHLALTVCLL